MNAYVSIIERMGEGPEAEYDGLCLILQCQYKCYHDRLCTHLTFFTKADVNKCVIPNLTGCRQIISALSRLMVT
jgi:hypothetical protein